MATEDLSREYIYRDHDAATEIGRLRLLESVLDPLTVRNLEGAGVALGWRCLEVGAGAGSIARWLASRVGATGHVDAVDLKVAYLEELNDVANATVVEADVVAMDLPEATYDLIHTRLLLCHLPTRRDVIPKLISALRPGGWLVVEEPGEPSTREPVHPSHPAAAHVEDLWTRAERFFDDHGLSDNYLGKWLPGYLRDLGLEQVAGEASTMLLSGGDPWARMWQLSWPAVGALMLPAGACTQAEVDRLLDALADPQFLGSGVRMVATRGQRP